MGKFNKGDSVRYSGKSTYAGTESGKSTYSKGAGGIGKHVSSSSSGVIVEKENGEKEFIHSNRINN